MTLRDRMMALIADRPEGRKISIPELVRAMTPTQAQIIAGIERLIAEGELDRLTLRRPVKNEPEPEPSREFRRGQSVNGELGGPLFDALKAEAKRRGMTLERVSLAIWNNRARIYSLTNRKTVRRTTADNIRAWLGPSAAEPPIGIRRRGGRGKAPVAAAELLAEVEAFCASGAMSKTRFSKECMRSSSALHRWALAGSTIELETAKRVREFIANHRTSAQELEPREPPEPRAAAGGGAADAREGDEHAIPAAASPRPKRPYRSMADKAERFDARLSVQRDTQGASGAHGDGRERHPESGLANGPTHERESRTPDTAAPTLSGREMSTRLEAYCRQHGLARTRVSDHLFGAKGAFSRIRFVRKLRPETARKIEELLAGDPPAGLEVQSSGGPRQADNGGVTGVELAAQLDALIEQHGLSKTRVGLYLNNNRQGVEVIRSGCPRLATIAKVKALLADPPIDELKPRPRANNFPPKARNKPARVRPIPETPANYADPMLALEATAPIQERRRMDLRAAQNSRASRKRLEAEAQRRIDAGKPAGGANSVHLRSAQMDLERRQREEDRLADPIEQAKTVLRRRFTPVVGAEYADPPGPEGHFLVGRKLVNERELLAWARRLAA